MRRRTLVGLAAAVCIRADIPRWTALARERKIQLES